MTTVLYSEHNVTIAGQFTVRRRGVGPAPPLSVTCLGSTGVAFEGANQ